MRKYKWIIKKLFIFIFFIFIFLNFYEFLILKNEENIDYLDDFDLEKNEKFVEKYLKLIQKGQAFVRPVYEVENIVEQYFFCFLNWPKIIEKSRKWTKMAGIEVYSAYYDDRKNSLFPKNHIIQVLSMSNHSIEGKLQIYCNIFQLNNGKYSTVKGFIREIWQKGWDPRDQFQIPNLISCPIPKKLENPTAKFQISLSRRKCKNQKIGIQVISKNKNDEEKAKKDVAVCVKGLDYQEDITERLLEWIEFQYYFGADKITIYYYHLPQKTKTLIKFYEINKGNQFKSISLKLSGNDPNESKERSEFLKMNRPQKRRHELIPYNDCFYSHIYTHKYVLIIDIDEIIVPILNQTYGEILNKIEKFNGKRQISSISARNVFKFQSNFTIFPQHFYMISNRKRSRKTSAKGEFGKSFTSTENVATVFNHFALHKLFRSVAKTIYFPTEIAIKLHYKTECPWESRNECHQLQYDIIDDTSLDNYSSQLSQIISSVFVNFNNFSSK